MRYISEMLLARLGVHNRASNFFIVDRRPYPPSLPPAARRSQVMIHRLHLLDGVDTVAAPPVVSVTAAAEARAGKCDRRRGTLLRENVQVGGPT